MTTRQWIVSVLIALHLVAVSAAAIPRPPASALRTLPRDDADPVARVLEPPLTAFAEALSAGQRWTLRATRRIRTATRPYIGTGVSQNWSMFSSVLVVRRYLRLDYYVATPGQPTVVFRTLVLPSQQEGIPRLTYRSADKAVRVVMGSYLTRLRDEESDDAFLDGEEPSAARLAPLIRHFIGRFSAESGVSTDQITRLEIWTGTVPIAPPGQVAAFPEELRRELVSRYRSLAPSPAPLVPARLWSVQEQGDISWQLVHVEERP